MKILLAGDWHSELHEEAVYYALIQLGHEVRCFRWYQYFEPQRSIKKLYSPILKAQNKYRRGPRVSRLNADLVSLVVELRPNLVFIYRGTHIFSETLSKIRTKLPDIKLVGYNNDDPFSPSYPKWMWRHFLSGLENYDIVFAYRLLNLTELKAAGAKQVSLLRSWFMPQRNFPQVLSRDDIDQYECDVVFVGHYEADGRLEYLEEVVRQGWRLRIFGPGYEWDPVLARSPILSAIAPVRLVWGKEYNKALCGAKLALCFFSRLNRDTYTRRCFEIPASGSLLLSEYSEDLASLFAEDEEAVYFKNLDEFAMKISSLLNDEERREQIARAGLNRVWLDGHDVISRMRYALDCVSKLPRFEA